MSRLLTAKEREVGWDKINKDFIKTSLQMTKVELDAANEIADQKNKKIIRQNWSDSWSFCRWSIKPYWAEFSKHNRQRFQSTTTDATTA